LRFRACRNVKNIRKLNQNAKIGLLGNYCSTRFKDFEVEKDDPGKAEEAK